MLGYKVFNPDWTCRDFQYEIGKIYEITGPIKLCKNGFHFCTILADCFNYYTFSPFNKVALIDAFGDILTSEENSKCCTNKIKIEKELSWSKVLQNVNIVTTSHSYYPSQYNTGLQNVGRNNSGNRNIGQDNRGDYNIGEGNSGNYNIGNYNMGCKNNGDFNWGDYNIGDNNRGNGNNGNNNKGDWNRANGCAGCFNTIDNTPSNYFFNRPLPAGYENYSLRKDNSEAYILMTSLNTGTIPTPMFYNDINLISQREKALHKLEIEKLGGYLDISEPFPIQQCWDNAYSKNKAYSKDIIKSIPNFNAEIFKQITGIDVNL